MILTLACPDRPGIVARVSAFLFERGCNILDAQQFDDEETGRFFMRVVFAGDESAEALRDAFAPHAQAFAMDWTLRDAKVKKRVMILASQQDHCLADLLYRWRRGELPMTLAAVVSNHAADTYAHLDLSG
ncbi:MAG: ACT domain-containing protein, partial [Phenylobacterium sp.]|nr:ACT domain-containing protein [Phenylobacterium sp.]